MIITHISKPTTIDLHIAGDWIATAITEDCLWYVVRFDNYFAIVAFKPIGCITAHAGYEHHFSSMNKHKKPHVCQLWAFNPNVICFVSDISEERLKEYISPFFSKIEWRK